MPLSPMIPFPDWAPAIPIPSLYWDVVSAEQRVKRICDELSRTEGYTDYVSGTLNELIKEFEQFKEMSDFDTYVATVNALLNRLEYVENILPSNRFDEVTTVYQWFTTEINSVSGTLGARIQQVENGLSAFQPISNSFIDDLTS